MAESRIWVTEAQRPPSDQSPLLCTSEMLHNKKGFYLFARLVLNNADNHSRTTESDRLIRLCG